MVDRAKGAVTVTPLQGTSMWGRALEAVGSAFATAASWFGPLKPLPPQAQQTEGRALDYPVGFNLFQRPRQTEGVSFQMLRQLADGWDLLRLCIETRKDQMSKLEWAIQYKIDRDELLRPRRDDRAKALEKFFQRPDGKSSWSTWMRGILEEVFVTDATTIFVRRTLGGEIMAMELVDGSTIKRVIDDFGRTPSAPGVAYQQILKGMPASDYSTEDMIYLPRNQRPGKLYGFPPVEQIITSINIAIRRQVSQLQLYTEGNIPEALFGVPDDWTPDQIAQFQAYWDSIMEGNTAARRHAKFVPGKINVTFTRDPQLKDEFDEWLARVVCYAFSLPPLPFTKIQNRATAEVAQQAAMEEGLAPLMQWFKELMDHIINDFFGCSDLEFVWDNISYLKLDPADQLRVDVEAMHNGLKSMDEIRAEMGLEPYGIGPMLFGYGPAGLLPIEWLKDPIKREQLLNPQAVGADLGGPGSRFFPADNSDPLIGVRAEVLEAVGLDPKVPPPSRLETLGPVRPEVLHAVGLDHPDVPASAEKAPGLDVALRGVRPSVLRAVGLTKRAPRRPGMSDQFMAMVERRALKRRDQNDE